MPKREQRPIPQLAERERVDDLAWIGENLHEFWTVARSGFEANGRGALIVDITSGSTNSGHPFGYVSQEQIRQLGAKDEMRMIAAYDPSREMVIVLLKPRDRMSSYRVGIPKQRTTTKSR